MTVSLSLLEQYSQTSCYNEANVAAFEEIIGWAKEDYIIALP